MANCKMRGSSALVIWPKVGEPNVRLTPEAPATRLGSEMPGRMLLVTFKASARNSTDSRRSPKRNSRESAVPNCQNRGPGTLLRAMGLNVPRAGDWNAAGLIQQLGEGPGLEHRVFCRTWTGRWLAAESIVSETSLASTGVTQ